MNSFLKELALNLYATHRSSLSDVTLVFPNRRAGLFFRKNLAEIIETPVWSPNILSMEDFVQSFSELQVADRLTQIFLLYDVYKNVYPQVESFDRFYSWGEIMLKDFDDIDKYLINPDHLFSSLKEQKEMESKFDYLTEEQRTVIKSFWSSFGDKISSQQQGFLKIWELLPVVYLNFKKKLKENKIAYEGIIYREVAQKCFENQLYSNKKIVFAGFNALSTSEEAIIKFFIANHKANIFWDVDRSYIENKNFEAGLYLRRYIKDKVFGPSFPDPLPERLDADNDKKIQIVGVPLKVGQAKKLGEKLLELLETKEVTDFTSTVVVLPEEHLLFPVLHSLPRQIKDINITMGFPLKDTSLNSLFEHLIGFQQTITINEKGTLLFHHKPLLGLLKHPFFLQYNQKVSSHLITEIEKNNLIYIPYFMLKNDEALYQVVFRKVKSTIALIEYLLEIILILNQSLPEKKGESGSQADDSDPLNENSIESHAFEKEAFFQYYKLLNRLKGILIEQKAEINISTFQKLFRQMAASYRLPFSGEPLLGLQIMGALETRNLDFENIFILSMNEGAFPAKSTANSYVPFNLRKGFGLPTIDQQDANFAYTFYRMLQTAKNVVLFHNTEVGTNINGEMSRYLFQLIYESKYQIDSSILSNSIKPGAKLPISILKSDNVFEKINQYLVRNGISEKRLTPSSINIYLDCRLKFYFRYIIGLKENENVQETVDPAAFGNILHLIMENIYGEVVASREGKEVDKEDFYQIIKAVDKNLHKAFSSYFSSNEELYRFEGKDIIASEIISKYVYQLLSYDKDYAPFQVLGLEADEKDGYIINLPLPNSNENYSVGLKGVVDRIDLKGNTVRVIDYKSGMDKKEIESITSLFDRDNPKRNKAAMQTFFYGLLFHSKYPAADYAIMPGIFNIKEMFSESFDFRLRIKNEDQKGYQTVEDVLPYLDDYVAALQNLLYEIFDPTVPFNQTENLKTCAYCPYNGICHRG